MRVFIASKTQDTELKHLFDGHRVKSLVRYEVLAAVNMNTAVFWDVTPCSLVEKYHSFTALKAAILYLIFFLLMEDSFKTVSTTKLFL